MNWLAWAKLTESKKNERLGFRDLNAFNTALLYKQVWRLLTKPNLLMSKAMKKKYFPKVDIFQAESRAKESWIWKSWNEAKFLFKEGSS